MLPDLRLFYAQRVDPDSERRHRARRIQASFHPQGLSCTSSLILVHTGSDNGNPLRGGASEGGPPRRTPILELSSDHRIPVHPLQSWYILVQTKIGGREGSKRLSTHRVSPVHLSNPGTSWFRQWKSPQRRGLRGRSSEADTHFRSFIRPSNPGTSSPILVHPGSDKNRRARRIQASFHPQGLSCKSSLIL
jgi:hypothetical protein